jgi:hypothetical protein
MIQLRIEGEKNSGLIAGVFKHTGFHTNMTVEWPKDYDDQGKWP